MDITCAGIFASTMCDPQTTHYEDLEAGYCALFAANANPPYSCTRDEQRSIVEAFSLAFGFAELIYIVLIAAAAHWLWRSFRRNQDGPAEEGKGHRGDGESHGHDDVQMSAQWAAPSPALDGQAALRAELDLLKQQQRDLRELVTGYMRVEPVLSSKLEDEDLGSATETEFGPGFGFR